MASRTDVRRLPRPRTRAQERRADDVRDAHEDDRPHCRCRVRVNVGWLFTTYWCTGCGERIG